MERTPNDPSDDTLSAAFASQTEYLRWLSEVDLRLFSGAITLQLALGAWLAIHASESGFAGWGILLLDAVLVIVAFTLLWKNQERREREVENLQKLMTALGLNSILSSPKTKSVLWLYLLSLLLTFAGIVFASGLF